MRNIFEIFPNNDQTIEQNTRELNQLIEPMFHQNLVNG